MMYQAVGGRQVLWRRARRVEVQTGAQHLAGGTDYLGNGWGAFVDNVELPGVPTGNYFGDLVRGHVNRDQIEQALRVA